MAALSTASTQASASSSPLTSSRWLLQLLILFSWIPQRQWAFLIRRNVGYLPLSLSPLKSSVSSSSTSLFGIREWREAASRSANRTVLLVPIALEEAIVTKNNSWIMIPGLESHAFRLKDKQYMDLVEEATKENSNYHGIVGIYLMKDQNKDEVKKYCKDKDDKNDIKKSGNIFFFKTDDNQNGNNEEEDMGTLTLCEIIKYNHTNDNGSSGGGAGAKVQFRNVGRAQLFDVKAHLQQMEGICVELTDSPIINSEDCQEAMLDIQNMIKTTKHLQEAYQQTYWKTLTTLGYSPSSLLFERDPQAGNLQKEIEASSWAALSLVLQLQQQEHEARAKSKTQKHHQQPSDDDVNISGNNQYYYDLEYDAFDTNCVLERLQLSRKALLELTHRQKVLTTSGTVGSSMSGTASGINGTTNFFDNTDGQGGNAWQ